MSSCSASDRSTLSPGHQRRISYGFTLTECCALVLEHPTFRNIDVCNQTVVPCTADEINSIFPPIGGRCNNINNPLLGSVGRPFRRLLPYCNRLDPLWQV